MQGTFVISRTVPLSVRTAIAVAFFPFLAEAL